MCHSCHSDPETRTEYVLFYSMIYEYILFYSIIYTNLFVNTVCILHSMEENENMGEAGFPVSVEGISTFRSCKISMCSQFTH